MRFRAIALLLGAMFPVIAQETTPNPPFRSESEVVQVPVSVTDGSGKTVDGLSAADFLVLSDGKKQEITLDKFDTGVAPISLAIAVQSSGISKPALIKIRRIGSMIQPLVIGARGEAAVISFADEVTWLQEFTSDAGAIEKAVKELKPGAYKQARMFDAVVEAVEHMKERPGRKVLLLISESRDRGSKNSFADALGAVAREGVEVFGAHYSAYAATMIAKPEDLPEQQPADFLAIFTELARLGKVDAIQTLTRETGGWDYPFVRERGIENAIEKLGADLHRQYLLSFAPHGESKGVHRIDVSLPKRVDLRVHARKIWWTDESQ